MPPRRSTHVNNQADPAFTAAVAQAVADLLPTLTARFRKEKPQTFSSTSTPVEAENWIAHIEKIFEVLGCDDQFKAKLATYKLEANAHSWILNTEFTDVAQVANTGSNPRADDRRDEWRYCRNHGRMATWTDMHVTIWNGVRQAVERNVNA
ncbi:hypothetical protein Tco_0845733 [Tanacetum coccineum]